MDEQLFKLLEKLVSSPIPRNNEFHNGVPVIMIPKQLYTHLKQYYEIEKFNRRNSSEEPAVAEDDDYDYELPPNIRPFAF